LQKAKEKWEVRKMRFFNKYFFIGVGAGVVLAILTIAFGGYLLFWWFSGKMSEDGKVLDSGLEPPPFPSEILADYDWSIKSLDGQDFKMGGLKGKVVFLNFWATWCPPCVAEMPSIQRLHDQLDKERVRFVCVSQEEARKVAEFVKEKGFTFPVYTMREEPPAVFRSRGIPVTFILSPDGKVAFKHVGSAKWDDKTSLDFIRGLIK
jgi:thiol-disulfide isomerase/thioredoxin